MKTDDQAEADSVFNIVTLFNIVNFNINIYVELIVSFDKEYTCVS